jgi:hypothetical protein
MGIQCVCCQEHFVPRNSSQVYCSEKECQRKRKSKWQKEKLVNDTTYRESQIDAQRIWRAKNPDYMNVYRKEHLEYTANNRKMQMLRRNNSSAPLLHQNPDVVNMDARTAKTASFPIITGTYALIPTGVVNMDAVIVQLIVLEQIACSS